MCFSSQGAKISSWDTLDPEWAFFQGCAGILWIFCTIIFMLKIFNFCFYRIEILCHDINVHIPHHVSPRIPSYNLRAAHESLQQNWGKVLSLSCLCSLFLLYNLGTCELSFQKVIFHVNSATQEKCIETLECLEITNKLHTFLDLQHLICCYSRNLRNAPLRTWG